MHKTRKVQGILVTVLITAAMSCCVPAEQINPVFTPGTRINGLDMSHLTMEEATQKLAERAASFQITVQFPDQQKFTIDGADIGLTYQPSFEMEQILAEQEETNKIGAVHNYSVDGIYNYDKKQFEQAINLAFAKLHKTIPRNASIELGEDSYFHLTKEEIGSMPNLIKLKETVEEAVSDGETKIELLPDCYIQPKITKDNEELNSQMKELNHFLKATVRYRMHDGSIQVLNADVTKEWLSVSEDNPKQYSIDDGVVWEKCREYVAQLAKEYDEVEDSVRFHSTLQGIKTISCDEYGYVIDQDTETQLLYEDMINRQNDYREPAYLLSVSHDDIEEGTYIEVDIENQTVFCYQDGQTFLQCECVSGLPDGSRDTIKGVFNIYFKQRDRTLQGPTMADGNPQYLSFVDFWMAFKGGYGLHNAPWRSEFGGDIYQWNGSHGCVNLSYESAQKIYEQYPEGTSVIVI